MKLLPLLTLVVGASAAALQEWFKEEPRESDVAPRGDVKRYVFATFTSKNEKKPNEVSWLHIYTSDDGVKFSEYAMNAYKPKNGVIRDPSIIKNGDTYYVAHTTSWDGDNFAVIKSKDLKNWELLSTVNTGVKNTEKTWAPEWFKDPADGKMFIYVSIKTKDDPFAPYIFTANNGMGSFGAGEKLDVYNHGKGVHQAHIDMMVVHKADDKDTPYHGFMKNEDEKHIEHLTSKTAKGKWNYVQTNNDLGFGKKEGPSVTTLPSGKWIMWMDNYHGNFYYSTSGDLEHWSKPETMPDHNKVFRHGTVIQP
ncbi:glycoside hydrolase family 43 protein [Hypoxylon sp. FL1284]|nr:glycoside hydrolase family 43 protein [Hypoxylon sp. FL1284]